MPRSRDRHGRGIRGPLARPNPWTKGTAKLMQNGAKKMFASSVSDAIADVEARCPDALRGVRVALDDIPPLLGGVVPLATAIAATPTTPAQVVLYRRPLELRGETRAGLRTLVHQVLVEQLAELTAYSVTDIGGEDFA